MKIGILSDTHGHIKRAQAACRTLQAHGVDAVCHCGDVGSEQVLIECAASFDAEKIPVYVVLGNVDLWNREIEKFPDTTSIRMLGRFGDLELDDRKIALIHGDDLLKLRSTIHSGTYHYVLTGHTHTASDEVMGSTRVINPGAVYRSVAPSIAVLDLQRDRLLTLPLDFAG